MDAADVLIAIALIFFIRKAWILPVEIEILTFKRFATYFPHLPNRGLGGF